MRNKIMIPLLALALFIAGCEKDDICASTTPTTPQLVIEFYNAASPTELKNVTNLRLVSGLSETIPYSAVSRIQVPLSTMQDSTEYRFVLNAGNANPDLVYTDELQFNYSRHDVFVSRACGYKGLFDLNNDDDPETPNAIILNGIPNDYSGAWIKNIVVEDYSVENEQQEVHVKIYF